MKTKSKNYDWETIQEYLKKELLRTKTILTFGTIGSLNIEHDIDIIVTKKPEAKSSGYQKELHMLFDNLDNYLKEKYGHKILKFGRFSQQEETMYIGNYQPGDLALHVMSYASLEQMQADWTPDLKLGESVSEIMKKSYKPIIGSIDDIFIKDFKKRSKYENLLFQMHYHDRTNTNFPEEFIVNSMNHIFRYVLKHLGINKEMKAKNKKEIRDIYYKILELIDEKNKDGN